MGLIHLACQKCYGVGTEKDGQCEKCGYDLFEDTLLSIATYYAQRKRQVEIETDN